MSVVIGLGLVTIYEASLYKENEAILFDMAWWYRGKGHHTELFYCILIQNPIIKQPSALYKLEFKIELKFACKWAQLSLSLILNQGCNFMVNVTCFIWELNLQCTLLVIASQTYSVLHVAHAYCFNSACILTHILSSNLCK